MILITGATGFLGKRVCARLAELNKEYRATSLSMGVDLRDEMQTMKLFDEVKPEYVLNCAAYVGGIQFGAKHPVEIFNNNLLMCINLFKACDGYHVKRIVNPISNCAYPGNASYFKEKEFWDGPLHDSVMIYGMCRKMSYIASVAYCKQKNLDTVNLVLSNMYGPGDHFDEERSHALGALIKKIVEAKRRNLPGVTVWGTGSPVREWLHVDDGAEAMIRGLDINPYEEIINVGVGKGISIRDMAELIKDLTGYDGDIIYDTDKMDGAPYKTVDGRLCERLLGWRPQTDFIGGVRDTIDWYINGWEA